MKSWQQIITHELDQYKIKSHLTALPRKQVHTILVTSQNAIFIQNNVQNLIGKQNIHVTGVKLVGYQMYE